MIRFEGGLIKHAIASANRGDAAHPSPVVNDDAFAELDRTYFLLGVQLPALPGNDVHDADDLTSQAVMKIYSEFKYCRWEKVLFPGPVKRQWLEPLDSCTPKWLTLFSLPSKAPAGRSRTNIQIPGSA